MSEKCLCDNSSTLGDKITVGDLLAEVESLELRTVTASLDKEFAAAIHAEKEGLMSVQDSGEIETYYLSCRFFLSIAVSIASL